jgi:hypothetical protein
MLYNLKIVSKRTYIIKKKPPSLSRSSTTIKNNIKYIHIQIPPQKKMIITPKKHKKNPSDDPSNRKNVINKQEENDDVSSSSSFRTSLFRKFGNTGDDDDDDNGDNATSFVPQTPESGGGEEGEQQESVGGSTDKTDSDYTDHFHNEDENVKKSNKGKKRGFVGNNDAENEHDDNEEIETGEGDRYVIYLE